MDENLAKIRHERSRKDFPGLSLEEGEFVEFAFSRAKIILMMIMIGIDIIQTRIMPVVWMMQWMNWIGK